MGLQIPPSGSGRACLDEEPASTKDKNVLLDDVFGGVHDAQLSLHMKPSSTHLERSRAVIDVAPAQAFLGDDKAFRVTAPTSDGFTCAQRLEHAAHGDSFSRQAVLVGAAILHSNVTDLAAVAEDATQKSDVRLLARLILGSLRQQPWIGADWARVNEASKAADRRSLWTWMLVFVPPQRAAATEAELLQRLPLSDEDRRYFYDDAS